MAAREMLPRPVSPRDSVSCFYDRRLLVRGRLYERPGIFLVAIHERIGAHVGERLDCKRRIEAAHRWIG